MNKNNMAIVLTGTIIPNSTMVVISDPTIRRNEYLKAINFYRQFAHVFFLENSSYPLMSDAEFTAIPNLSIRKFAPSKFFERGKGFQEFEMLDKWIESETTLPQKWLKITGRYIYYDIDKILNDCNSNQESKIIIDQHIFFKRAQTAIFCVNTDYYKQNIYGIYHLCDDRTGEWVERVLYRKLMTLKNSDFQIFSFHPSFAGTSGSTGQSYKNKTWIHSIKLAARKINFLIDKKYIWYSLIAWLVIKLWNNFRHRPLDKT